MGSFDWGRVLVRRYAFTPLFGQIAFGCIAAGKRKLSLQTAEALILTARFIEALRFLAATQIAFYFAAERHEFSS